MTVVDRVAYTIVNNNAPIDTTPAWQSGTSYQPDTKVKYKDQIYICAIANQGSVTPDKMVKEWVNVGNPNETKFQDKFINTQTTKSDGNLEITINVPSSFINAFALFNVDAKKVSVFDNLNDLIFEKEMTESEPISNWWQYFFGAGFTYKSDIWFLSEIDYNENIKIVIEPNEKGANLGHLVVGKQIKIGDTEAQFSIKIIDFSKVSRDPYGNLHIREGKKAKYADVNVIMPTSQVDFNRQILASLEKPALFVGDEKSGGFESLTILGLYEDLEIIAESGEYSTTKLSIEGVV
ncbi:hypothetical protein [Campylobacter sp. RM16187]|uniref:hypothetical protein n=1 Tax=Campylobacter sp. RM16187 TaxID=1660063 RepID=UPI0021B5859E|nr:hypothetical protein [Campylobacter sp. RM16187]QKG29725.1 hypothetical protein CDOMF_1487 [Campylobacter sp. RM16187]